MCFIVITLHVIKAIIMKTIFTSVLCIVAVAVNAQILLEENFDSYPTGVIIGQNGYHHSSSGTVAGSEQAFQVVESGSGKYLKIITRPENGDYLLYKGFALSWKNRDPGNNVIEVEYDMFTGPSSTRTADGGLMLFTETYNWIYFGSLMFFNTKRLTAATWDWDHWFTYHDLGANKTPVNLPANQWVRLKFSYSVPENDIWYSGSGFHTQFQDFLFWPPATDFKLTFQVNNDKDRETVEFGFDNIIVRVVSQSTLGVDESHASASEITIYPNPVTAYLNITAKNKILSAYIYDLAGVRQEITISDGKVDVKKLTPGSYILGIKTDSGFATKKFIKTN